MKRRSLLCAGLFLVSLLSFSSIVTSQPTPTAKVGESGGPDSKAKAKKQLNGDFEVRFTDDSKMRFNVLDDMLPFTTDYGTLQIPMKEVKQIHVGIRLDASEQKTLVEAIANLIGQEGRKREEAKEALEKLGIKALPQLRRTANRTEGDALAHVLQVIDKLKGEPGAAEVVDRDVIVTEDSRIAGKLTTPTLRIETFQFGELKLKFSDVKQLAFGSLSATAPVANEKFPELVLGNGGGLWSVPNIQEYLGKTVVVKLTGRNAGSIWGTMTYTLDSDPATAAVHAGALTIGETKLVKIKIVSDIGAYTGSTRNGVTSSQYNAYPSGAYEIIPK